MMFLRNTVHNSVLNGQFNQVELPEPISQFVLTT